MNRFVPRTFREFANQRLIYYRKAMSVLAGDVWPTNRNRGERAECVNDLLVGMRRDAFSTRIRVRLGGGFGASRAV